MLDDTTHENDLRRRLQEAAGPVDGPAALVARSVHGGRRRLRRRQGVAGASAVAVLATALVVATHLPGSGTGLNTVAASPTSTPAPSSLPTPEEFVLDATLSAQALAELTRPGDAALSTQGRADAARAVALTPGVNAVFAKTLPGFPAATGATSTTADGTPVGWNFTATDYDAVDAQGKPVDVWVYVSVVRPSAALDADTVVCAGGGWVACQERTLSNGTLLRSGLVRHEMQTDHAVVTATTPFAFAVLPDGRLVDARSSVNWGPDATEGDFTLPTGPPLTVEALEELVTSPQLAQLPAP